MDIKTKILLIILVVGGLTAISTINTTLAQNIWGNETVSGVGDVGEYSSLAIDSNNTPHVAYYNRSNSSLEYAVLRNTTATVPAPGGGTNTITIPIWFTETVDNNGDVGRYASIAVGQNDNPHIAYWDFPSRNLKYAVENNSWDTEVVDSGGNVGEYTSIDLFDNGLPSISYYDITNSDLKYASIIQQNQPPTASFMFSPNSPSVGQQVSFDASGSSDIDGQIVQYMWDFNGDGNFDMTSMNPTVSNTYQNSGSVSVTLEVQDNDGATATTQKQLTVTQSQQSVVDIYDTNNQQGIQGPEVRRAIKCFLFGGNSCIGSQLGNTQIQTIIKAFLFN